MDELAGAAPGRGDGRARRLVIDAMRIEEPPRRLPFRLGRRQRAGLAESGDGVGHRRAVLALELEQQALEIAGHLDVQAGAEARRDALDGQRSLIYEARQD